MFRGLGHYSRYFWAQVEFRSNSTLDQLGTWTPGKAQLEHPRDNGSLQSMATLKHSFMSLEVVHGRHACLEDSSRFRDIVSIENTMSTLDDR